MAPRTGIQISLLALHLASVACASRPGVAPPGATVDRPPNDSEAKAKGPPIRDLIIEQGGQALVAQDHTVRIERRPFTIVLTMNESGVVLVSAAHEDSTWRGAVAGVGIDELNGFRGTGIADHMGNPEKELFIEPEAPNAWPALDGEGHRFDGPCTGAPLVCRRTVEQLAYPGGRAVDIGQLSEDDIFLVFAVTKWLPDFSGREELQSWPLRLQLAQ